MTPPAPGAADDTPSRPDPDADLTAFLDGELDPDDARVVESRLSADPAARTRATALKKTFDLLDFLPKPEPSPTFATRTVEKLPKVASSPAAAVLPAPAVVPVRRGWVGWAAGVAIAATVAGAAGYFVAAAVRPSPHSTDSRPPPAPDDVALADLRVVENLPVYAAADDLEYVRALAAPDLFGDDPGPARPGPAADADKPAARDLDAFEKAFKAMPADRQQRVRDLDQQLHDKDGPTRLFRVLEGYAVWVHRLPDADRKQVLTAATPAARLAVVRDLRDRQWAEGLPKAIRDVPDPVTRAQLITRWKADADDRRRPPRVPWPFTDDALRKEVQEFVNKSYAPRLPALELARLRAAEDKGTVVGDWQPYGEVVYALTTGRRYEMLPDYAPGAGKTVTTVDDLWPAARVRVAERKNLQNKLAPFAGKWPDFALAVLQTEDGPGFKLTPPPGFHFGPARPDQFRPDTRRAAEEVERQATADELTGFKPLEGKWPDYPRRMAELGRLHDVRVAEVMPPGSPREWDRTYAPKQPK